LIFNCRDLLAVPRNDFQNGLVVSRVCLSVSLEQHGCDDMDLTFRHRASPI